MVLCSSVRFSIPLPVEREFTYKVIITNKKSKASHIIAYHEGRGCQEKVIGDLKSHHHMDYVPVKSWNGNKAYLMSTVIAHNLIRKFQVQNTPKTRGTNLKRTPQRVFESISTWRRKFILRAGRLTNPSGTRTLTLSVNEKVKEYFEKLMPQYFTP